ncbi:unnamed protein product [Calypogeia fissa]
MPAGNKEAMRKYREKQKAVKVSLEVRNTELEKENQRIPELQKENARRRRKLQEQGPRQDTVDHLLAENKRLRSLLSNFRRAIDSEFKALEDVSHQKLCFTSNSVDGVGGTQLFSAGRTHGWGLGRHTECELVNNVTTCNSPQEELKDTGADLATRFGSEIGTPYNNGAGTLSGSKKRPRVCKAKLAATAAARGRNVNFGHIPTAPVAPVYQQQLPGGIPCSVASGPMPCFSCGPREAASHPGGLVQAPQGDRWKEECGIGCREVEMTSDSSLPQDVIQSVSKTGSGSTLVP